MSKCVYHFVEPTYRQVINWCLSEEQNTVYLLESCGGKSVAGWVESGGQGVVDGSKDVVCWAGEKCEIGSVVATWYVSWNMWVGG